MRVRARRLEEATNAHPNLLLVGRPRGRGGRCSPFTAAGCAAMGSELRAAEAGAAGPVPRTPSPRRTPESVADLPWWQVFQDPALQALIREGVANNLDLKLASARVVEVARAGRHRQVVPVPGDRRRLRHDAASRSPASAIRSSSEDDGARIGPTATGRSNGTLSWEIDLFGRIRRGREAAVAQYLGVRGREEGGAGHAGGRHRVDLPLPARAESRPRDCPADGEDQRRHRRLLRAAAPGRRVEPPRSRPGEGQPCDHGGGHPQHRAADRDCRERPERPARPGPRLRRHGSGRWAKAKSRPTCRAACRPSCWSGGRTSARPSSCSSPPTRTSAWRRRCSSRRSA